jgi:hypothetical protein
MVEYVLDGTPVQTAETVQTWGTLLENVDGAVLARGRSVTAVRFNGVAQPSFRSVEFRQRTVATLGNIEILSDEPEWLIAETLGSARQSVAVLVAGALRIGREFRGPDPERASRDLKDLIEAVRTLSVLTAAIADAVHVQSSEQLRPSVKELAGQVERALRALAISQSGQDWTRAAERLEHQLAPALMTWGRLFDRWNSTDEAAS